MARKFLTVGGYRPSKEVVKGRPETREEREARITALEEEAAKPTGFDILLETKDKNLTAMRKLLKSEPSLTREQLATRLKISKRTAYRYLRIIREGQQVKTTMVDELIAEKAKRVTKLVRLMRERPEYSRSRLAEEVGVSRKTLYSYLDELGL